MNHLISLSFLIQFSLRVRVLIQQQDAAFTFAVFTVPSAVLQNLCYRTVFILQVFMQIFSSFDQCKALKTTQLC